MVAGYGDGVCTDGGGGGGGGVRSVLVVMESKMNTTHWRENNK